MDKGAPTKSLVWSVILWVGIGVFLYLFSTGPVVRWFPNLGEAIYAPLSSVADNEFLGPALRAWLRLWGVDADDD
jgi:hypothetical protein